MTRMSKPPVGLRAKFEVLYVFIFSMSLHSCLFSLSHDFACCKYQQQVIFMRKKITAEVLQLLQYTDFHFLEHNFFRDKNAPTLKTPIMKARVSTTYKNTINFIFLQKSKNKIKTLLTWCREACRNPDNENGLASSLVRVINS
jgi:hypothetical protein